MARVLMIIQHSVGDYDAWRIQYDKAQPIRERPSVSDAIVLRNADELHHTEGPCPLQEAVGAR
jgi:hypothetical protein